MRFVLKRRELSRTASETQGPSKCGRMPVLASGVMIPSFLASGWRPVAQPTFFLRPKLGASLSDFPQISLHAFRVSTFEPRNPATGQCQCERRNAERQTERENATMTGTGGDDRRRGADTPTPPPPRPPWRSWRPWRLTPFVITPCSAFLLARSALAAVCLNPVAPRPPPHPPPLNAPPQGRPSTPPKLPIVSEAARNFS